MKEDLICGVAILLYLVLLYLLTTIFIKTGEAVDRYKMKKKTDKIKVGQRYELKNKGVIACENDAEYCVLMDGEDHFISIAKDMSHDYCCEYVVERAEAYRDYPSKGATCSVCLFEDNENKAREMLKEAIIELSKNSKIDCDGL